MKESVNAREKRIVKERKTVVKKKAGGAAEAEIETEQRSPKEDIEETTRGLRPHLRTIEEARITEDPESAKITVGKETAAQKATT